MGNLGLVPQIKLRPTRTENIVMADGPKPPQNRRTHKTLVAGDIDRSDGFPHLTW